MENAEKYPENFNTYPQNVKDIIERDILRREKDDPVRIAYDIALEIHSEQKRKGIEKLDYITHPLQVYDFVNRVLVRSGNITKDEREVILAASLLHDGIEDYKKDQVKSGKIKPISAALDAEDTIIDRFVQRIDPFYFKKVDDTVNLVFEVTNKLQFEDKDGNKITKIDWQVGHMAEVSTAAKLIKIADKTLNIMSNIVEGSKLQYEDLIKYVDEQTKVVTAAENSISPNDKLASSVAQAARVYHFVANHYKEIFDNMKNAGMKFPPGNAVASLSLQEIDKYVAENKIGVGVR
jgi:hypothetical protein